MTSEDEHEIAVRGGSGGTAVGLDALDAAAAALLQVSGEVTVAFARLSLTAVDPDLLVSAQLSPVTSARAAAQLARCAGPAGLSGDAAALSTLAVAVGTATAAYREAESEVTRTLAASQDTIMAAVGWCAAPIVVGALTMDALGVDVAGALDELAYDAPELAELGGGVDGLVVGLQANPLTRPLLTPGARGRGDEQEQSWLAGERNEHGYEEALRLLADSAARYGLLSDRGSARVTAEPRPRQGAAAPVDLATLAGDQANLGDGEDYPGHVRVIEVPLQEGSAWIVEISGTQVWNPKATDNAYDVTTDARVMGQEGTVLAEGVEKALSLAQQSAAAGRPAPTDEPVMLVGHSLGGIVAGALASAPKFTDAHRVTHVVTMGSPVGRMPVPPGVEVLSLEHRQDAVPRLDGRANPDRRGWVTVTRDLVGDADRVHTASGAHATQEYVQTAGDVDASHDASVVRWRQTSRAFFVGDAHGAPIIRDYRIERLVPSR